MSIFPRAAACIFLISLVLAKPLPAEVFKGTVVNATSGKPIEGAFVTLGTTVARTGADGTFAIEGDGGRVGARAYGHGRTEVASGSLADGKAKILLPPLDPKALYLSFYGIGHAPLRNNALRLLDETELNALVIDVKGDRGMVAFKSSTKLVAEAGAGKVTTIKNPRALIQNLRQRGVYSIARIVTFKDNPLAAAKPEWAVKNGDGEVWRDREDLAWADPFQEAVWDYNIAIAVEAAQHGFDEIQFDYVRFPDATGLTFSKENTEEARVKAISGFLSRAREKLAPYNVFLAADIFGYVCWNVNDTAIGQRLEDVAEIVDYLSPMLYPSGFSFGIPKYRNPVEYPYEIVSLTLKRAKARTNLPGVRFRPWLQAFRDYAFDKRVFDATEIQRQTDAAEDFGANGWMLWNPRNVYEKDDLIETETDAGDN
jgi:hypothetical protein